MGGEMMKYLVIGLIGLMLLVGCTTVQKGAAIGGATGAALGGIIGHQVDRGAEGAAIGAGVGAVTGAIIGEQLEVKFCPSCGKGYTEGVKYCPVDGTELQYKKK